MSKIEKIPSMDLKEIQELIKIFNKSKLAEITIERDKYRITLKSHASVSQQVVSDVMPQLFVPQQEVIKHAPPPPKETKEPSGTTDESKYVTIKSPMIGTFYRSSSPDKPPMINVGDEIQPGSVLCIIEAMKLFNEIESEYSGKIVKILVENAKPVEYDQPLFLIEPM